MVGAAGAASAAAALQKRVAVARHAKVNGMRGGGGSVVIGGGSVVISQCHIVVDWCFQACIVPS